MPLPELPLAPAGEGQPWNVRRADGYPGPTAEWFHTWRERDGRLWLRLGRTEGRYVLRFAQWAAFEIDPAAREIACIPAPETPDATLRHLLLNQVLPLIDGGPQRIVLHAAAVSHRGGAIAFAGESGSGKSTLCAALSTLGCEVLTDDALVLQRRDDGMDVVPTYAGLRLWPDAAAAVSAGRVAGAVAHYTDKIRVTAIPFRHEPIPLAQLCVLARNHDSDRISVTRMPLRDAVVALTRCQFHLDIEQRTPLLNGFAMITSAVKRTPVFLVSYPWRLDQVRESAALLLASIASA
jgi:hypothetical protein